MEFNNRKPLIICVCGKAGSGKSLVGNYIRNYYNDLGKKVIISPYTKYLKKYISEITGWDMEDYNKPRELLQKLSSDLIKGKLGYKDIFINRQIEDIDIYSYFFDVIIIPDVRFPNEIEVLKKRYYNVVSMGVIRDNYDNKLTDEEKNDVTEISLDGYRDYDYMLYNNGDDKLYNDTISILSELKERNLYE